MAKPSNTLDDIIIDMIDRVAKLTLPPDSASRAQMLLELEKQLRDTWGGDRPYIAHRRGEASAQLHSERNSRIWRQAQQGRHIAWMAKAEGLSERRILQIIGTLRAGRRPTGAG